MLIRLSIAELQLVGADTLRDFVTLTFDRLIWTVVKHGRSHGQPSTKFEGPTPPFLTYEL